eukprot:TRINITY_DN3700_c3_g1_i1.p1 TRINITY_DN3700_c3_g1~~TRINITY_DN3700_c3_g1_i1.p1  ORF type:complete len:295 (-),score=99.43 TRINITY_DN3700_c3_g1_i1:37-921(-)
MWFRRKSENTNGSCKKTEDVEGEKEETEWKNLVESDFDRTNSLKPGAFGEVEVAKHRESGKVVVIKKISRANEETNSLLRNEMVAGQRLQHENIVAFYGSFQDATHVHLVLQHINGKDLFSWLEERNFAVSPLEARKVFKGLASALEYAHRNNVAHLDVKLENVMVTKDGVAKLIDFGLCSLLDQPDRVQRWSGSPDYASPQVLLRKPYSETKADVWSLGVLLHIMLVGVIPFHREHRYEDLLKGVHPNLQWSPDVNIGKNAKDLIGKMLQVDEKKRITMAEVVKHSYTKKKES